MTGGGMSGMTHGHDMGGMTHGSGMGGMTGGSGMGGMTGGGPSATPGHEHAYDTFTINGKAYPAGEPLRVRKGERVRLRLINVSAEHTHVIRLGGHRLLVTHSDGNPLAVAVTVDAVPIAPSERYDVMFVADRPGAWFLYCAAPGHLGAGDQVPVVYEGFEGASPEAPAPSLSNLVVWDCSLGQGRQILPAPTGQSLTYDLALAGGMMGSDAWTINGKQYPNTDPMRLKRGDRVRVRFANTSTEAHPMHLHGQSFRVLAVNGRQLSQPLIKDTVNVEAPTGSAEIEFTASNPGDWLFHCHKAMHMDGGMVVLVKIE
jgi:FtsP/CotA-like multicopper oxidase with cupredoxin domain